MKVNKDQIDGLSNLIYTETESTSGIGNDASVVRTVINGSKVIIDIDLDVSSSGSVIIDYIPQNFRSKKFFKITTMITNLHTITSGRDFGTLSFNKLLDNTATPSVIQISGKDEGQFNYLDDTVMDTTYSNDGTFSMEYNSSIIPNITTGSLSVTYTPLGGGSQAVGKVKLLIEGFLM